MSYVLACVHLAPENACVQPVYAASDLSILVAAGACNFSSAAHLIIYVHALWLPYILHSRLAACLVHRLRKNH